MRISFIVVTLITLGALSACNTMSGAGQDIQNGGAKLEHSADDNK